MSSTPPRAVGRCLPPGVSSGTRGKLFLAVTAARPPPSDTERVLRVILGNLPLGGVGVMAPAGAVPSPGSHQPPGLPQALTVPQVTRELAGEAPGRGQ